MENINLDLLTIKNSWTVCDCKYCTDNNIDYLNTCIFFLEIQKISKLLKNINNLKNISFNNLNITFKPSSVLSSEIVINLLSYLFKLLESIKEPNKRCVVCCSTFEIIFLCKKIFLLNSKLKDSITERLDYIINKLDNNTTTYHEFYNASKILNPFCKFKENLQLFDNCNRTIFLRLFNRNTIIYKFSDTLTFIDLVEMLLNDDKIKSTYKLIGGYKGKQLLKETLLINQIDDFNVPIYIV